MKDRKKQVKTSFSNHKFQMKTIPSNGVNDKFSNDNLFKTDKRYWMNKYLDFDSIDENSYQQMHKVIFSFKIDHLSIFCFIRILYNFNYNSMVDYYKGTYYLISFFLSYYFIRITHLQTKYLEIGLKVLFIFNTLLLIVSNDTPSIITIQFIASELFFTYINGLFLNLSLCYMIPLYFIITLIHICKVTKTKIIQYTLFGLIYAFHAANGLAGIVSCVFFLFIYYCYLKGKKELWALFDSFKRSYLILDELIFKDSKTPSFVLAKNFAILYLNQPAIAFIEKIKDNKCKGRKCFNNPNDIIIPNSTLLDFISPQLKDEFLIKFNTCLAERKQKFYFPFVLINNNNCSQQCNLQWGIDIMHKSSFEEKKYMVIPSRCVWKNQESYFVRICNEIIKTSFYNYMFDYSKYLIEQLLRMVNEADKISESLLDSEVKYEQYTILLNKINSRNITGNENDTLNKIIYQKAPIDTNSSFVFNEDYNKVIQFNQFNQTIFTNNKHFINKLKGTNITQLFSCIDHSVIFFFNNQFEVFFDMQLTKEVYTSLILQIPRITISQIDLKSLAVYFEEYFYVILRIKNLKLKFIIKCDCNISVEYNYLRTILFNTLMFIYSVTDDDSNEKSIIYTISLEKEPKVSSEMFDFSYKNKSINFKTTDMNEDYSFDLFSQNNTHILKFSIVIWDDKQKTNYNVILKEVQKRGQLLFHLKEEIEKAKKLDIGLVTLFYLITAVYSKELEMFSKEGEHTIAFEIGCGITKLEDEVIQFEEIDTDISDPYYKELLKRVYHINVPDDEIRERTINRKLTKTKTKISSNKKKSISQNNKYIKINEDSNLYEDMAISFSDTESTIEKKENEEKHKTCNITKNKQLKPIQPETIFYSKSLKNYSKIEMNVEPSFFTPPKLLIVEVNQFARNQLINLITELNREYQIVIAEDGNIAMSKLKEVYDKNKLYNIVFMEVNFPYQNRIEIATSIRNAEKNYPPHLQTKIIGISINPNEKISQSKLFDHYSK